MQVSVIQFYNHNRKYHVQICKGANANSFGVSIDAHTHTPINLATIYLWLRNLLCVNVTAKNGFAVLVPAA